MKTSSASTPILIGSKTSPYVRRLLLLLKADSKAVYEFKAINYLENPDDAAYLKNISPINKIPVLVDGENKVFESRVIAAYLAGKFNWSSLSLEQENMLSMIDAANDVAVNFFLMRKGGFDIETPGWYIDRQRERVRVILDNVEAWAKKQDATKPADWNYVTMSLFSYISWANFRKMADFSKHPGLIDFDGRFGNKTGVSETAIPGQ